MHLNVQHIFCPHCPHMQAIDKFSTLFWFSLFSEHLFSGACKGAMGRQPRVQTQGKTVLSLAGVSGAGGSHLGLRSPWQRCWDAEWAAALHMNTEGMTSASVTRQNTSGTSCIPFFNRHCFTWKQRYLPNPCFCVKTKGLQSMGCSWGLGLRLGASLLRLGRSCCSTSSSLIHNLGGQIQTRSHCTTSSTWRTRKAELSQICKPAQGEQSNVPPRMKKAI